MAKSKKEQKIDIDNELEPSVDEELHLNENASIKEYTDFLHKKLVQCINKIHSNSSETEYSVFASWMMDSLKFFYKHIEEFNNGAMNTEDVFDNYDSYEDDDEDYFTDRKFNPCKDSHLKIDSETKLDEIQRIHTDHDNEIVSYAIHKHVADTIDIVCPKCNKTFTIRYVVFDNHSIVEYQCPECHNKIVIQLNYESVFNRYVKAE